MSNICFLFCFQPMHDNYDLRQEQMNKSSLLSSRKFLGTLLEIFTTHVVRKPSFQGDYWKQTSRYLTGTFFFA